MAGWASLRRPLGIRNMPCGYLGKEPSRQSKQPAGEVAHHESICVRVIKIPAIKEVGCLVFPNILPVDKYTFPFRGLKL